MSLPYKLEQATVMLDPIALSKNLSEHAVFSDRCWHSGRGNTSLRAGI